MKEATNEIRLLGLMRMRLDAVSCRIFLLAPCVVQLAQETVQFAQGNSGEAKSPAKTKKGEYRTLIGDEREIVPPDNVATEQLQWSIRRVVVGS
ncbi:hypothetical protein BC567DRAFT_73538 [Phyllosticta citribraziliensis]